MRLDAFIEECMDEDMESYTCSEEYQSNRAIINNKVAEFRDNLTSKEQQEAFRQLIDLINTADADFSINAHRCGFKAGMAFHGSGLEG